MGSHSNLVVNQEEVRRVLLIYLIHVLKLNKCIYILMRIRIHTRIIIQESAAGRKYESIFSHPYYGRLKSDMTAISLIEPPHEIYSYNNISVIPKSRKGKCFKLS